MLKWKRGRIKRGLSRRGLMDEQAGKSTARSNENSTVKARHDSNEACWKRCSVVTAATGTAAVKMFVPVCINVPFP